MTPDDLVEIEAIKRLKYRYLRGLDQKDWAAVESCFT
ncbi:MAG: nuclear transport factor 2 family protein, partial [Acidimicrobiia bacterium]